MMTPIYMDYAATTPTDQRVVEAMLPCFGDIFGNPSSLHGFGQDARAAIEEARAKIASFIGAKTAEVVFTSGGTESDNFAIKGVAWANRKKGDHIITSAIEHHAVLESCRFLEKEGFKVTFLPVDSDGLVDPAEVAKAITDRTVLISIMHANNEIGTIEPIAEIGRIAKERKVYFHTDAVQTFGHLPFTVDELNVDLLSASAHKLCGPKGVGLLYIREGTRIVPFMHGGEQENGRRASTQNVPGIVGFGKAVELAAATLAEEAARLTVFRDRFIKGIFERLDGIRLNGHPTRRLPNNITLSVESIEGEGMVLSLDMLG
ncbi:MAG: aminotransferase class V-fold PLP-dependent enzyme, partial [Syntrophales bacterium]|nr:aminotransferase class V-fold PLP-dependent enzyme [Syntrophales bacterium]